MKDKWNKLEIFHKSFFLSLIISLLILTLCAIALIIDSSYIFGALIGEFLLLFSYLIIWIIWYKIPRIKLSMAKMTPILSPLIRILIYITFYLIILIFINDWNVFQPINTFTLLIVYTITPISYFSILIGESIFQK